MNKDVIIIGASGHGRVIADIVRLQGDRVLGFLDDRTDITQWVGAPILGAVKDYSRYPEAAFIVAIGNGDIRQRIVRAMKNVRWYTAIHPQAILAGDVTIGEGSALMAGSILNPGAAVGAHCIINTGAIVEHDCAVESFAHISVGAKLAGTVRIGKNAWIGIGAIVNNNLSVCDNCTVGAGAVVVKSITEAGTYVGVPARRIR